MESVIVSIRAPVKGATFGSDIPALLLSVSIRAPVKGATPRAAADPSAKVVSIRAPVKGATVSASRFSRSSKSFNPRPREGGDCLPHRARCA